MMGSRHAASGVAAAAVTLPIAAQVGANPLVWVAAWVGAGLLPDMDSGGSHAARVWGWPTRALGTVLGKVAGGHRESTHDIIVAPIAAAALITAAATWRPAATLTLGLLFGICGRVVLAKKWRRARPLRHPLVNAPVALAAAWWVTGSGTPWWVAGVVAAGIVLHVLCDSVTIEGAPLPVVWIWRKEARSVQWGLRYFRTGNPKPIRGAGSMPLTEQARHPSDAMFGPLFYAIAAAAAVHWVAVAWILPAT